ncbi:GumC family protein [uncultured Roseibium sp.]|uniref:GumC family protein n=1 Tax=uncultured Roseibium sp. TaxID=1936171 RepID=UPI002607E6D1|nr:GumC family protein [uncultured Roseibium sp.]
MIDITDIPALLKRNIFWLLLFPVIFAGIAFVFVALKTPVYETRAELLVQPEGAQTISSNPVGTASNQSLQSMDLDSQTHIILSAAVLNQVANNLGLDDSPQFQQLGLRQKIFGGFSSNRSSAESREATLEALREALNVYRIERSLVFVIVVKHTDAELAAAIANETANAYIEQSRTNRTQSLARASESLSAQAEQLQGRVETAEAAVEAYKARQGLISTAGGSVIDQQLDALNNQITEARVTMERAKVINDQMASLTLADVEAGIVPQDAISSVLNSLRVQYSRIAQQEAEAATTLGANHPTLRELRSQMNNTGRQIQSELQRIKQTVKGQFEQARLTLSGLEQQSKNLQSQNTLQGKALIELRQLQSEADASRSIYEAFLKRSRELEELPDLGANSSRILSEAPVPSSPTGPNKIVALGAGSLFGFVFAAAGVIGLSLLRGNLTSERAVATGTGAPILANISAPANDRGSGSVLTGWLGKPSSSIQKQNGIARTRVAYALRQAFADEKPANILVLSIGNTGNTSRFIRNVAVELHDMGEEVLFAHTVGQRRADQSSDSVASSANPRVNTLNRLAMNLSDQSLEIAAEDSDLGSASQRKGLSSYLRVEQIDTKRKYAANADLASSYDDFLLIDAGNIDASPLLPVLLRHCDGIILITALGETRSSDFERTTAYLEPWQDRIIGNVVLSTV